MCLTGEDADVVAVHHGGGERLDLLEEVGLDVLGREDVFKLEALRRKLRPLRVRHHQVVVLPGELDPHPELLLVGREAGTDAAVHADVAFQLLDLVEQRAALGRLLVQLLLHQLDPVRDLLLEVGVVPLLLLLHLGGVLLVLRRHLLVRLLHQREHALALLGLREHKRTQESAWSQEPRRARSQEPGAKETQRSARSQEPRSLGGEVALCGGGRCRRTALASRSPIDSACSCCAFTASAFPATAAANSPSSVAIRAPLSPWLARTPSSSASRVVASSSALPN